METFFLKLLEQLNGSIFILSIILVLAFLGAYKTGTLVSMFNGFKEERAETKKDLSDIKTDIATTTATVNLLYQSHLSTVKSHSPLSLTTIGEEISQTLNLEAKVANHWTEIKSKIEEQNPSNPYDIQKISLDVVRNCFEKIFTEEEKNEIKQNAYKRGLNLLEFFPIIGIIARDKILEERGINLKEIDNHKP